ncbi:MAG: hypothetical protein ACYCOU_06585 [Sulfobacillus sp.]
MVSFLFIFLSLMLAFTVSQYWGQFNEVRNTATEHLLNLMEIYRILKILPNTEKLVQDLYNLLVYFVNDNTLDCGKISPLVYNASYKFTNSVMNYIRTNNNHVSRMMIPYVGRINYLKFMQIVSNNITTPMWSVLGVIGLTAATGLWFVKINHRLTAGIFDAAVFCAMGITMFLFWGLSHPFTGMFSLSMDSYHKLIHIIRKEYPTIKNPPGRGDRAFLAAQHDSTRSGMIRRDRISVRT